MRDAPDWRNEECWKAARRSALAVIDLWEGRECAGAYLESGDPGMRAKANRAAWEAVEHAAALARKQARQAADAADAWVRARGEDRHAAKEDAAWEADNACRQSADLSAAWSAAMAAVYATSPAHGGVLAAREADRAAASAVAWDRYGEAAQKPIGRDPVSGVSG